MLSRPPQYAPAQLSTHVRTIGQRIPRPSPNARGSDRMPPNPALVAISEVKY